MLTTTIQRYVDFIWKLGTSPSSLSSKEWNIVLASLAITVAGIIPAGYIARYTLKYRKHIQQRVKDIESRFSRGLIYRDKSLLHSNSSKSSKSFLRKKLIRCLELHPDFVKEYSGEHSSWQLISLGEYLSTLRPNTLKKDHDNKNNDNDNDIDDDIPELIQRELAAVIGGMLLRHLGPKFGSFLLPMLGISSMESFIGQIASTVTSWVAAHILVDSVEHWDPIEDSAAFPFALTEISSMINLNQKIRKNNNNNKTNKNNNNKNNDKNDLTIPDTAAATDFVSSMEWMRRGEIGYDPSFSEDFNREQHRKKQQKAKEEEEAKKQSKHPFSFHSNTQNDKNENEIKDKNKDDNVKEEGDLCFIPNPFIVEDHFDQAIFLMEERIQQQSVVTEPAPGGANTESIEITQPNYYDPEDRSFPPPTPINERILPGLHLGWGNAKCTHTKREILRNRLVANIMTKLSYNYYIKEVQQNQQNQQQQQAEEEQKEQNEHAKKEELFVVILSGKKCYFPDEFIKGLIDTGHVIETVPCSTITTFGIAACVKEDDGSWSNIPIGFFFQTGYERADGRPAYFYAPHGGVNLSIQGPLIDGEWNNSNNDKNNNDDTNNTNQSNDDKEEKTEPIKKHNMCDIQFYVAIEGLCGWHSNHNADVPWIKAVKTTDVYNLEETLQAVRMAGLLAVTWNSIATEMNLPFGGYGVLGLCNDSAAFVDCGIRGETNVYPIVSTGRFLSHTARRLLKLMDGLSKNNNDTNKNENNNTTTTTTTGATVGHDDSTKTTSTTTTPLSLAIQDARRLVTAACTMDSDIHTSPAHLVGATRRYLANYPVSYFQLTADSKEMMTKVATLWNDFLVHQGKDDGKDDSEKKNQYSHTRQSVSGGYPNLPNFMNFLYNSVPQNNNDLIEKSNNNNNNNQCGNGGEMGSIQEKQ